MTAEKGTIVRTRVGTPGKNMTGGRGSESLRISFLEAVYGFRVSFLSLCTFLGYEFNVMAVLGAVCAFH